MNYICHYAFMNYICNYALLSLWAGNSLSIITTPNRSHNIIYKEREILFILSRIDSYPVSIMGNKKIVPLNKGKGNSSRTSFTANH